MRNLKCNACGHTWKPKTDNPKSCPGCTRAFNITYSVLATDALTTTTKKPHASALPPEAEVRMETEEEVEGPEKEDPQSGSEKFDRFGSKRARSLYKELSE